MLTLLELLLYCSHQGTLRLVEAFCTLKNEKNKHRQQTWIIVIRLDVWGINNVPNHVVTISTKYVQTKCLRGKQCLMVGRNMRKICALYGTWS